VTLTFDLLIVQVHNMWYFTWQNFHQASRLYGHSFGIHGASCAWAMWSPV